MKRENVAKGCLVVNNSSQSYHRIITEQKPFVENVEIESIAVRFEIDASNCYLCSMRRFLAMALVLWYGLFAIGLHIHVHYCCGQIANIAINTTADACSSQCAATHHAAPESGCSSSCGAQHHTTPPSQTKQCCTAQQTSVPAETSHCSVDRSCCSSDDIHLSIDEAHAKSSLEFELPAIIEEPSNRVLAQVASRNTARAYHPAPRDGIPLYRLYQQPRHYL
jgi:hypothetical protein